MKFTSGGADINPLWDSDPLTR